MTEDFEERIRVLKEEGKTDKEICLILEHEGVNPTLIIARFGGAYTAAKREDSIILPRKKLLGYLEGLISPAMKDEMSASKEYREMADLAERLGMSDAAEKLRGIAQDEDRHHDILYDILVSIPQEIAKIYKK